MTFGAIWCSAEDADAWMQELQEQTGIPPQFIYHDAEAGRLEVPLMLAEGIASDVDAPAALSEAHPTHHTMAIGVAWHNHEHTQ